MRARWEHIYNLAQQCLCVPGDFCEFGVWQGSTFLPMAHLAATVSKRCHAVDSFRGCPAPSEKDRDEKGRQQYPSGSLSVGGPALFQQLVNPLGDTVCIWKGFVPKVLNRMDKDVPMLAFVHVDLDQYLSTLAAIRWSWSRLSPGGIMACHDFVSHRSFLAAGAIHFWMEESGTKETGTSGSGHIWFQKKG